MIAKLRGIIDQIGEDYVIIDVSGNKPLIIIANNITINGKLDLSGKPGGNATATDGSGIGSGGGGGEAVVPLGGAGSAGGAPSTAGPCCTPQCGQPGCSVTGAGSEWTPPQVEHVGAW